MAGAATLEASTAILKVRYPNGRLPKALYERFKFMGWVPKREDFTGESRVIAIQNENPQGVSADFQTALGSMAQGNYRKFTATRVEEFGIVRIKGQALKAAEGDEGALVDLWKNECDGISMELTKALETYSFGNGSGTLGQIASGQATVTVTLSVPTDISKFSLGMRLQAVSDATLSPTLRNSGATVTVTAIDRSAGTLTSGSAWSAQIPAISTDFLVRAGDYASSATARVMYGTKAWVPGGTAPGTLFGLNRNEDPVRFAGQAYNATTVPMEEAAIEASALVNQQGAPQPTTAFVNPRDLANFKKAIGSKVTYDRTVTSGRNGDSGDKATVSFKSIEIEGDESRIQLVPNPFVGRYEMHLLYDESWKLDSLGPAPQLLDFDDNNFLRVASDDAYEARFGFYGQLECNLPYANIILSNWGN